MNWRVSTKVAVENVIVVTVEAPKVAVPVGTVAPVQLAPVFQSLVPGLASQVAF